MESAQHSHDNVDFSCCYVISFNLTTSFWRWCHAHFIDMKSEVQLDEICQSR